MQIVSRAFFPEKHRCASKVITFEHGPLLHGNQLLNESVLGHFLCRGLYVRGLGIEVFAVVCEVLLHDRRYASERGRLSEQPQGRRFPLIGLVLRKTLGQVCQPRPDAAGFLSVYFLAEKLQKMPCGVQPFF